MPQKIDIHGLFIDPEKIIDLALEKRKVIMIPVFQEVSSSRSFLGRLGNHQHVLCFDHHIPYGIALADAEHPEPSSFVVNFQEAFFNRMFENLSKTGRQIAGHVNDMLKIDFSPDRAVRVLQSGRMVKSILLREIPAKVLLQSGQWVDVFNSTPGYDFQGGSPLAVTDGESYSLLIATKEKNYMLYGSNVDVDDNEIVSTYHSLVEVYNQIQAQRDAALSERQRRPLLQMPQINIQIPKVELPKLGLPKIKFQSPFVIDNKEKEPVAIEAPKEEETDN